MKKKLFVGLVAGMTVFAMSATAFALMIQSESIITNPASTVDLWAYSYDDVAAYITSGTSDYVKAGDPYTNAIFQGYVTGDYGPGSVNGHDSWGDAGAGSDFQSVHVFDTYITSAIDQTVTFINGGDDGHSVFIDDNFLGGAAFNITSTTTFDMVAGTEYKLSYIGANYHTYFGWWFNMSGSDTGGGTWSGAVSEAHNITMNAIAGDPVPEPATMLLFGTGLVGLAGSRLRKKKK